MFTFRYSIRLEYVLELEHILVLVVVEKTFCLSRVSVLINILALNPAICNKVERPRLRKSQFKNRGFFIVSTLDNTTYVAIVTVKVESISLLLTMEEF